MLSVVLLHPLARERVVFETFKIRGIAGVAVLPCSESGYSITDMVVQLTDRTDTSVLKRHGKDTYRRLEVRHKYFS